MGVLATIGREVKALSAEVKSLPFSNYGAAGYGGGGYGLQALDGLINRGFYHGGGLPGTRYDYRSAAGVLWENPSAAACFVALTKAFAQARPILEQRKGKEWEHVEDHPLVERLNAPNPFYSGNPSGKRGKRLIQTLNIYRRLRLIEL